MSATLTVVRAPCVVTLSRRWPSFAKNVSCGRSGGLSKNATQPAGFFKSRSPTVSNVTGFSPALMVFTGPPLVAMPSDSMSGFPASMLKTAAPVSASETGHVTRTNPPSCATVMPDSTALAGKAPPSVNAASRERSSS